jgi:hypothetical protein
MSTETETKGKKVCMNNLIGYFIYIYIYIILSEHMMKMMNLMEMLKQQQQLVRRKNQHR